MENSIQVELADRSYPIRTGRNQQADWLFPWIQGKKVLLVADTHTAALFANSYMETFRAAPAEVHLSVFEAGECSKTLSTVEKICRDAVAAGLDRSSVFIALGGGVCGDMTGLAAALYMRGTRFIQIPTTLLAMVDSSVGGKTGVDLPEGKNLIGTFFQPLAVLIDPENLRSLPLRQLANGFAEIVKTAMIFDRTLFQQLETFAESLFALKDDAPLESVISLCCQWKAAIVAEDEREQGRRALLNYGHTFGHALESRIGYGKLEHGEAIAIGMCMAADLAVRTGRLNDIDASRLEKLLQAFHLPVTAAGFGLSADDLLEIMHHDKKNAAGVLRIILADRIGHAEAVSGMEESLILESLRGRI